MTIFKLRPLSKNSCVIMSPTNLDDSAKGTFKVERVVGKEVRETIYCKTPELAVKEFYKIT